MRRTFPDLVSPVPPTKQLNNSFAKALGSILKGSSQTANLSPNRRRA